MPLATHSGMKFGFTSVENLSHYIMSVAEVTLHHITYHCLICSVSDVSVVNLF